MTQEEKQLLLKTLCEMLPYGVMCTSNGGRDKLKLWAIKPYYDHCVELLCGSGVPPSACRLECVKPYLRPMESMTDEEKTWANASFDYNRITYGIDYAITAYVDYLYSIHIDCHNLIPKGLALPAKEGMYNK